MPIEDAKQPAQDPNVSTRIITIRFDMPGRTPKRCDYVNHRLHAGAAAVTCGDHGGAGHAHPGAEAAESVGGRAGSVIV